MSAQSQSTNDQSRALTGQRLVDRLHSLIGHASQRLWIASPYVGAWKDVKKILGATWEKLDVRLLVDKESGFLSRDTMGKFATHRPIRSLRGLHAKIYVVDNTVLLTSANLTGCAFRKRHEVGFLLDGATGQPFIRLYKDFWAQADEVSVEDIPVPKRKSGMTDEPNGMDLPELWKLPSAPSVAEKASGSFSDYQHFLEEYAQFVQDYLSCGDRDEPAIPIYFETDAFLDFLFHSGEQPSQSFQG
jgi:phosphatidylserine/phosphatidylglycerophosphate/cardiolipin synthase-like enzyme